LPLVPVELRAQLSEADVFSSRWAL
jgi:hypothetical protein